MLSDISFFHGFWYSPPYRFFFFLFSLVHEYNFSQLRMVEVVGANIIGMHSSFMTAAGYF